MSGWIKVEGDKIFDKKVEGDEWFDKSGRVFIGLITVERRKWLDKSERR